MPLTRGFLDGAGHPRLRIAVSGTTGSRSFDALVDTGFTGFLLVPEASAGSLGLIPLSTTWHTLADGGRVPTRIAIGTVEIESGERYKGTIALGNVVCPLIGMDFLRAAKKALYVDSRSVALLDEDELRNLSGEMGPG